MWMTMTMTSPFKFEHALGQNGSCAHDTVLLMSAGVEDQLGRPGGGDMERKQEHRETGGQSDTSAEQGPAAATDGQLES